MSDVFSGLAFDSGVFDVKFEFLATSPASTCALGVDTSLGAVSIDASGLTALAVMPWVAGTPSIGISLSGIPAVQSTPTRKAFSYRPMAGIYVSGEDVAEPTISDMAVE